ncbi:MAG TPA: DUF4142 domain-containing protein [Tepidisphaeraceae bacterium]
MTRCLTATLAIATFMILSPLARADVNDKVKAMQSPADSKQFAMKAAEGGMLEVKLAQLAQQKSQDEQVKDLAKQLEQDHQQANQQLMQIAKQKNIDLPNDLKGECQETYQAFQQLQGKDFDNAFVLHNVKDHLMDIMMFQKEAQNGTDPEIKQWASQTLPKLQEHARQIATVAQACGLPIEALAAGGAGENARTAGSRIRGQQGTSGQGTSGTSGTSGERPRTGENK